MPTAMNIKTSQNVMCFILSPLNGWNVLLE